METRECVCCGGGGGAGGGQIAAHTSLHMQGSQMVAIMQPKIGCNFKAG